MCRRASSNSNESATVRLSSSANLAGILEGRRVDPDGLVEAMGGVCGGGTSSHQRKVWGGAMPLYSEKNRFFSLKMACFSAF